MLGGGLIISNVLHRRSGLSGTFLELFQLFSAVLSKPGFWAFSTVIKAAAELIGLVARYKAFACYKDSGLFLLGLLALF